MQKYSAGFAIGIVTHFAVEMCYDSVTFLIFQVFVNLTISLTGVTLASTR